MELEPARTPSSTSSISLSDEKLKLVSVVGGEAAYFDWKPDRSNCDTVAVLFDVIQQCINKFQNIRVHFTHPNKTLDMVDKNDFDQVREILDKFNNAAVTMSKLWKGATNPEANTWSQDRADVRLLTMICNTAFNSAVSSVKLLNSHYQPFSSEVYGETKLEQMQKIIEQLKFKDSDIFVDLGSGVGNLVTYVAGATKVRKSVGIEKAIVPAGYAEKMKVEYKKWMGWFKKKYRPFELHTGDFLSPEYKHLITQEATIVFINNYAFNPDLEMRIKRDLIEHMSDGTRIVSTKPYAQGLKNLTERHMNDVESMLDVTTLQTVACPTSWTDKVVPYYLHTVSRAKIEEFYFNGGSKNRSNSQSANVSRRPSMSSKSSSSSREGSLKKEVTEPAIKPATSYDFMDEDENATGPTTRHQWKEYTSNYKKRKNSPAIGSSNSPKWNDIDREYLPPGTKKTKKAVGPMTKLPKPPKKIVQSKPTVTAIGRLPKMSDEARAGINELHNRITSPPKHIESEGDGLVRVSLPFTGTSTPEMPAIPPGALILDPNNPIQKHCIDYYRSFTQALAYMQTDECRKELKEEISKHSGIRAELLEKTKEKEQQVKSCVDTGVGLLNDRLKDLGMEADTPSKLLTNSKGIVAHHKDLTLSVSQREAEVACLEGKTRSLVPYGDALLENLGSLDENLREPDDKYMALIIKIATENGYPAPQQRFESEPETVDGVLSPGGPRRRARTRNSGGRKGKTEESNEEVDRKVQEIMLSAKRAENIAREQKDRRSRGNTGPPEKTRKPNIASVPSDPVAVPLPRNTLYSNTSSFPTSSQPSDIAPASFPIGTAYPSGQQ